MAQVIDQRIADIDRQREPLMAILLAAHDELAGAPVDVPEVQPRELTGT